MSHHPADMALAHFTLMSVAVAVQARVRKSVPFCFSAGSQDHSVYLQTHSSRESARQ